jgi:hypothetical protein
MAEGTGCETYQVTKIYPSISGGAMSIEREPIYKRYQV